MIEQLSFFDNEKTERERIFDAVVEDLSEVYKGLSKDDIVQKLRARVNSGGSYKHGWLIAYWRASLEISVCRDEGFEDHVYKYVDIAQAIAERQEDI